MRIHERHAAPGVKYTQIDTGSLSSSQDMQADAGKPGHPEYKIPEYILQRNVQLEEEARHAAESAACVQRTSDAILDANPYPNLIVNSFGKVVDCNNAAVEYFGFASKLELRRRILPLLRDGMPVYQPSGRSSVPLAERLHAALYNGHHEFETELELYGEKRPLRVVLRRIEYMGAPAAAIYVVDLEALQKTKSELWARDRVLQAANAAASLLLSGTLTDYEQTLVQALEILGSSILADRAYIWRIREAGDTFYGEELAEWSKVGASFPRGEHPIRMPYEDFYPPWRDRLAQQQCINEIMSRLDPSVQVEGMEDVSSLLILPIFMQEKYWGFLGFDDCVYEREFTGIEEEIMRSGGMMVASAVMHQENSRKLISAKEEAQRNARAKSEFLSRMSHEMRTPMNAIIGMTTIAKSAKDPAKMRYCLEKVESSSRHLLAIINDVLDMSSLEANTLKITPAPFDFMEMLRDVVDAIQPKIKKKRLVFLLEQADAFSRYVIGDELHIAQVLLNLLSNATKFTDPQGHVTLRVACAHTGGDSFQLHVDVEDDGIGLSRDQQQRMFRPFEQADGSITRRYGGTGLGLAICHRIVSMMGGQIGVSSEEGAGARFYFNVPLSWGEALPSAAAQQPDAGHLPEAVPLPSCDWQNKTVLMAEDVALNREILLALLEDTGLRIVMMENGREAVEEFHRAPDAYDLILMDIQMPEMDGLEATRRIRKMAHARAQSIPILAMTANALPEDVEACMLAGMNEHIAKPIEMDKLFQTLTRYLG